MKHDTSTLSSREVATYSLGALAREIGNSTVNSFILVYLTIYRGLNPMILTVAIVLARLWDAINDPMLATLVNNTGKRRLGRYRPWILGGALLNAVICVAIFIPVGGAKWLQYVYYIVLFVLWGMSFTCFDVPYWSMLPTIANTTRDRNRASSFARLIGGFGGFTIVSIGNSVILPRFLQQSSATAYFVLGVVGAGLMLVFVLFLVFGNREKFDLPQAKIGLGSIFSMFRSNDQLRAYAGSYALYMAGNNLAFFQLLYLYIYCYENAADFFNSRFSYTMFWVIACTFQGLAMMFYTQISKHIPREKICSVSIILSLIGYVLLFVVFFFLQPAGGEMKVYWLNTILVAVCASFSMLGAGVYSITSTVMIADVVDYGEWKTGIRGDSVIFSVQTLLGKFSTAAAQLLLGLGITVAGLPKIMEVLDPATGMTVQRFVDAAGMVADFSAGESSLVILRCFMFLLPVPLTILSYVVYKRRYWLYGAKYDAIKEEVESRRE